MSNTKKSQIFAHELEALSIILEALEPLDDEKRRFVLKTASDRFNISDVVPAKTPQNAEIIPPANNSPTVVQSGTSLGGISAKDFLKSKRPLTDVQRIACLAFYLTYGNAQNHFKTGNLTKLNTDAAAPKLSNAAVSVMHAAGHFRFLSQAGGGKKQITSIGEDVVNALPDQAAVKSVLENHKSGYRKKNKRTKVAAKKNK